MGVIFDLDQTIIDSRIAQAERTNRNWNSVYELIPSMRPYKDIVNLIHELLKQGIEVAVVTSSPRPYCERILNWLGITGVVTVCYHDTEKHKPYPDPLLEAVKRMKNQNGKKIIVIGDEENDVLAAESAGFESALAYWGNYHTFMNWKSEIIPDVFCRDEESLLRYFKAGGVKLNICGLRESSNHIFHLLDYYPVSRVHDRQSIDFFHEIKGMNDNVDYCNKFCRAFENDRRIFNNCGLFVVPSSTAGKWNRKLTHYVAPWLERSMGLINFSEYILRHTTHEKQAFGGDRSVESNLSTMKLQYTLPSNLKNAIIIDDITTTGNILEACSRILCSNGIPRENIYCVAIGKTV